MSKTTVTRTFEYDDNGRVSKETEVTETEEATVWPSPTVPSIQTWPSHPYIQSYGCSACARSGVCHCVLGGPQITNSISQEAA